MGDTPVAGPRLAGARRLEEDPYLGKADPRLDKAPQMAAEPYMSKALYLAKGPRSVDPLVVDNLVGKDLVSNVVNAERENVLNPNKLQGRVLGFSAFLIRNHSSKCSNKRASAHWSN